MHAPSSTRLIQPQDCDASASISDEQFVIMLHTNIFAKRLSTQFTTACRPSWLASSLPDAVALSLARWPSIESQQSTPPHSRMDLATTASSRPPSINSGNMGGLLSKGLRQKAHGFSHAIDAQQLSLDQIALGITCSKNIVLYTAYRRHSLFGSLRSLKNHSMPSRCNQDGASFFFPP